MHPRTLALLGLTAAALVTTPLASANHGLVGGLVGALDDGNVAYARLSYVTGNFDQQTWLFDFTTTLGGSFSCYGFGSIEVGFTSDVVAPCPTAWATGPSGDAHTYPYNQFDVHQVSLSLGGANGVASVQVLCPDSGNTASCGGLI